MTPQKEKVKKFWNWQKLMIKFFDNSLKRSKRWFRNWKPIHLCWWFRKHGWKVPKYLIGHTPWDVSTAVYDNKSKYVGDKDTNPYGIFFNPDGTKMYMVGYTNGKVFQYSLSTAWDVSTATYSNFKDVSGQEAHSFSVSLKSDGTKMYIAGDDNITVYQYSLSTAWNVSTATYDSKLKNVSGQVSNPVDIFFKPDGTKMYIVGNLAAAVYQYSLSTAWDVSTATYESKFKSVSDEDIYPYGVFFKPDGTKMYIAGDENNKIYQYSLSTDWDVSTASYDSNFKSIGEDSNPLDVFFRSDGMRMYIMGLGNKTVYQYSLPPPVSDKSVLDSGSGADAVSVVVKVGLQESGAGEETPQKDVKVNLQDAGQGQEIPTIKTQVGLSDSGQGQEIPKKSDQIKVQDKNLPSVSHF